MRGRSNPLSRGKKLLGLLALAAWSPLTAPCDGQTLYDFGNPTAEEQHYLELINRARAFPGAEGGRLATTTDPDVLQAYTQFGVDLGMLQTEFNNLLAQPPLAPNAKLTTAARGHSQWMLNTATQAHNETNPTKTLENRLNDVSYPYSTAGENIFAYSKNGWHGHAGFEVDWGSGTSGSLGGMQNPRGHRNNLHSSSFREIGVGVVLGSNGGVGPQLVTQDFATQSASPTFGTGVAYYDLNSNNFYDIGEGISGLTVNVNGASYYCNTAAGGGWTVPVPTTAATRTVTFSGLNLNQTASLVVPASTNAKADLKLAYSPPSITSSATAIAGSPHTLNFTATGGATEYTWNRWLVTSATAENCEATTNVTTSTTGTYAVLNTTVKQQGLASFHFENSTGANQSIQLNGLFYGQASPSITFQSSVRYATSAEYCKVQVKDEGSTEWRDVFSQAGNGGPGEATFNSRSAPLTGTTGKPFRIRFLLNSTGSYFGGYSGDNMGWFVDAINFSGVSMLENPAFQTLTGTSGSFTPVAGSYLMSVSPVISGRNFPASYQNLTSTAGSLTQPVIDTQPSPVTISSGTTAAFTVAASGGALGYQWYAGSSGVTSSPVAGATSSTFTTPPLTSTSSYWVRVSNTIGTVDSNSVTATVITPPSITGHPAPATINSGSTATFTVTASGTSPTYQWYVGNTGITTQPVAGATGSSFTTPALTSSTTYWVRVSNSAGHADSNTVAATVLSQPVITGHPASVSITSGTTTTFTVAATGGNLAYQWYAGASGVTTNPVAGATTSTFTTPALTATAGYWVRVSNAVGNVNSNTATATVVTPPSISSHPVSLTVVSGNTATFSVTAAGSSPAFQWYVGNKGTTSNPVSGATTHTFTTGNLSSTTNYWVRVSNSAGVADSNTATATVVSQPVITSHPASSTISNGATATLNVTATGGNLTYQWYAGASGVMTTPIAGATAGTFITPALTSTTSYWVRVSNPAGNANSNTATVTVASPPTIRSQPVSTTITKGTATTISVMAAGPSLTYQWYAGDTGVTGNPISGATANTYTTPTLNSTKKYWVRVSNAAGNADSITSTITTQNGAVTRNFSIWAAEIETANGLPANSIANDLADFDKDGRTNLIEYAFGASPVIANDPAPRMPALQATATHIVLQYQRDTALGDLTFTAQACADLANWKTPGESGAPTGFTDTLISTNGTVQTREAKIPRSSGADQFLRMRVLRP